MPESPIRMLAPFAEAAKKNGRKIYHLNIGQPDIETPAVFWEELRSLNMKVLAYGPSNGFESLRERYAAYFREECRVPNLSADDLLITTGASEGLMFTLLSILDERENIIIPEPLYANYIGYARSGNIRINPIDTRFEDNFALPSIDEFERAIDKDTKAILICNPSNPTGYLYSRTELLRLREIALEHDLFLISDEVYKQFNYTSDPHHSILTLPGLEDHAILIDSFSKRFSACGARIGVIASKNRTLMHNILKFAQQRLCPPSLSQLAGMAFFDLKEEYFTPIREEYISRRDTLVDGLNAIPGVRCGKPNGAFYCIAKLPVDDATSFSKWLLSSFDHDNATVMLAPAEGFYATPGRGKDEVRIAYVLNKEDLQKALVCLQKALEVYPGRKET